jgi:hypothetical protein
MRPAWHTTPPDRLGVRRRPTDPRGSVGPGLDVVVLPEGNIYVTSLVDGNVHRILAD